MTKTINVFVYGSLLSGAGHPMGVELARRATMVGDGTIVGKLYAISWYPGVVDVSAADKSDNTVPRVCGEVYALRDRDITLTWLDEYERSGSKDLGDEDYVRVERSVRLADGQTVVAWVYIYCQSVASCTRVLSGRWLDHLVDGRSPPAD